MNSRSCDATRNLWCPAGTCICTGNYQWNTTAQNCSCGAYQTWTGFKCQNYGYYGDPCSSTLPCQPTLTCQAVVNQTYTTGQSVCVCDNTTYLITTGSSAGTCVTKLTYNASCLTTSDCQSWLGLSCTSVSSCKILPTRISTIKNLCFCYSIVMSLWFNSLLERIDLCQ